MIIVGLMDGRNVRELSKNEIEEVNGGVGSLVIGAFFVGRMAVTAYRTNPAFRSSVNTSARWAGGTAMGAWAVSGFSRLSSK